MSKTTVNMNLKAFDKLLKEAKEKAETAELHSLDQTIKINELNLLVSIDKLIDRSQPEPEQPKEVTKKVTAKAKEEVKEDTKESNKEGK